ncbi:MAG TPA: hypothetical protein VFT34_17435 [Verrucomicrobiae bacterium]|nr:hypothetical protein [Verrucomicrobiae bacterium]
MGKDSAYSGACRHFAGEERKNRQEWEKWLSALTNFPILEVPAELERTLTLKLPWQTWLFVARAAINQDCQVEEIIRNALVNSEDIEDWGNEDPEPEAVDAEKVFKLPAPLSDRLRLLMKSTGRTTDSLVDECVAAWLPTIEKQSGGATAEAGKEAI